ncbi:MAG: HIT family protein [Candidatus Harrisonbacteria bacterium CG10_big_fil_rev_8_21_14_0_10_40_38]|uniref:HIT family protein n=1 Tax=Candidatus Harrisonbacteria bacterium CG10_big_fil_rev_8_21_14_0_10_40_38 TaxID=1974583 RepID=A0A2H0URT5_9BACT|nr:MAG: HIT family protein [Candidatus Harrisonbacteria bacterium CG10_big_fil_rev_8_21_14_0_10_40_38]
MDCLFCKIAEKEIPSEIIYEDENTVSFLDIHPRSLGHTVVISKSHSENIIDLPENMVGPLFRSVKKVTSLIKKTLDPKGFTIGINHGKISDQVIDHLHVHIIPRYDGDKGSSIHSVVNNPPNEPINETVNRIKNGL